MHKLTTVVSLVLALAGCGGAAAEEPRTFDMSAAETPGAETHGDHPADVALAVEHQVDLLASRVMDCVPGRASLALELGIRRSGTIFSVHGDDLGEGRACVHNVLVGAAVADPLTAEMLLRHTFVRPPPSATSAGTATPSAPPREDPTRATLAAVVDAHAPEILTCSGRALVGVRLHWETDGRVWLSLQGDLAASPEEACVRDAIGAPTIAPGSAGELVRLVRAQAP